MDIKQDLCRMNGECDFAFLVLRTPDEEKFAREQSFWERRLNQVYGVDTYRYRRILLGTLNYKNCPQDEKNSILGRWEKGLFDSVSRKYFVITSYLVPTFIVEWKEDDYMIQDEMDVEGLYNGGREDVTRLDLVQNRWGLDQQYVAVREKLNGSRFVLRRKNGKSFFSGLGRDIPVSDEFPVLLAEYFCGEMKILYPYAIPTFDVLGLKFSDHNWTLPQADDLSKYREGAMILVRGLREKRVVWSEKRIKWLPTSDVDVSRLREEKLYDGEETGVWEVWCNFRENKYELLRPRPGKLAAVPLCGSLPTLADLRLPVYDYSLEYSMTGSFRGNMLLRNPVLVIDSGWRRSAHAGVGSSLRIDHIRHDPHPQQDWFTKVDMVDGRYQYQTKFGRMQSPHPLASQKCPYVVVGGKVFLFRCVKGKYQWCVIRDNGKSWDMPGGKTDDLESPVDAAVRELLEELVLNIDKKVLAYIGLSSAYERGEAQEYHTYMYMVNVEDIVVPEGIIIKWLDSFEVPADSVPWLKRLINHVQSVVGEYDAIGSWYHTHVEGLYGSPQLVGKSTTAHRYVRPVVRGDDNVLIACRYNGNQECMFVAHARDDILQIRLRFEKYISPLEKYDKELRFIDGTVVLKDTDILSRSRTLQVEEKKGIVSWG